MHFFRLLTFIILQISLVGLMSFRIAIGAGAEDSYASSGCGAGGAGSCGANQIGFDGASSDDQNESGFEDAQGIELDAGYPIDIPVPIAKGIDGIDPSSLVFSESTYSQLKSFHHLLAVSSVDENIIGTISGRLKNHFSCESEKRYGVILKGTFVFEEETQNCEINIPVSEDWIGFALPIVVFDENQEEVSHPVITKVNPAPNDPLFAGKNYILEIQITNTSEETIDDTQADIQDQEITFLADGNVIFQSYNNDLFPFLSQISPYGGANEAISFSEDIDGFLEQMIVSRDNLILSYNQDRDKLYQVLVNGLISSIKDHDPALNYDPFQSNHPSSQYYASRELISGVEHLNIHDFTDSLNPILSQSLSSRSCENGSIISLNWHDSTKVAVFKKCDNHNYELDIYNVASAFNDNPPEAELIHRIHTNYYIGKAVSDWGAQDHFYYECQPEEDIQICKNSVSFPHLSQQEIMPIDVGTSDLIRLSLSQDRRSYLVFEVDDKNDDPTDNIVGYYDLNDQSSHFTGMGFRPLASPVDNDLVACLGKDESGNIQIGLLNIPHISSQANPLSINSDIYVGLNQFVSLDVQGGVPPYQYEILEGDAEVDIHAGIFFSGDQIEVVRLKVSDANDQEKVISIHQGRSGAVDSSFGEGGILDLSNVEESSIVGGNHIIHYPDGRILVAGFADASDFGKMYTMAVTRYFSDGSLDSSFGNHGSSIININNSNSIVNHVALDDQGRIILVGQVGDGIDLDLVVARVNHNGMIDSSFGNDGIVVYDVGDSEYATSVKVLNDSSLLVSGSHVDVEGNRMLIIKLHEDGSYDESFQNNGSYSFTVGTGGSNISDMVLLSDDSFIVGGFGLNALGQYDFALSKFNSNGEFSEYFGSNGVVITDIAGNFDKIRALAVSSQGSLIAVGDYFADSKLKIAKYLSNGDLDTSFNDNGVLETTFGYDEAGATDVEIQFDGKIMIAGYVLAGANRSDILVRYHSNGELDTNFGDNGMLVFDNTSETSGTLSLDQSGNILFNHSTLNIRKFIP